MFEFNFDSPPSAAGLGFAIVLGLILAVAWTTQVWIRGGRSNNTYRAIIVSGSVAAVLLAMVCVDLRMTQGSYNVWADTIAMQTMAKPSTAFLALIGMALVALVTLSGFITLMVRHSWTWAAAAACLVFAVACVYADVFAFRRYSTHWSQLTAIFWILTALAFVVFLVTAAYQREPGSIHIRHRRRHQSAFRHGDNARQQPVGPRS